jgi:hypothetical protein
VLPRHHNVGFNGCSRGSRTFTRGRPGSTWGVERHARATARHEDPCQLTAGVCAEFDFALLATPEFQIYITGQGGLRRKAVPHALTPLRGFGVPPTRDFLAVWPTLDCCHEAPDRWRLDYFFCLSSRSCCATSTSTVILRRRVGMNHHHCPKLFPQKSSLRQAKGNALGSRVQWRRRRDACA